MKHYKIFEKEKRWNSSSFFDNLNELINYSCSSISTAEVNFSVFSISGVDNSYTKGNSAYIQHVTHKSKTTYPVGLGFFTHGEQNLIISYNNHRIGPSIDGSYTYKSECLIISYASNNDLSGQHTTGLRITNNSFKAFEQN